MIFKTYSSSVFRCSSLNWWRVVLVKLIGSGNDGVTSTDIDSKTFSATGDDCEFGSEVVSV
mgnify:CR=1 FL=1